MSSKIDYEEITKLVNFLEEKKLAHFELEVEGFKVKISRSVPNISQPEMKSSATSPAVLQDEPLSRPEEGPGQELADNLHYIKSPMVGTFYRASDPTSPPLVEEGDPVKKNQILCIIEAMKLMNEIDSDIDGILKEIYVENGKPVEYGQKLFAIQALS